MEFQMSQPGHHMSGMIPTWRYQHSQFPKITLVSKNTGGLPSLEINTGWKYSMDIKILTPDDPWIIGEEVCKAVEDPRFKDEYGTRCYLNPTSRRSNAKQGSHDNIEAP
jgi:hypothetical protein